MLIVIRGLENWKYLLENTKFKFEIWIDYKNLEYFMKVQKLNRRQARWKLYLSRFDFTLKHVLRTKIKIKDYWVCNLLEVVIEEPEVDIIEKIKIARSKDKEIVGVVEEMKRVGVKKTWGEEWQIEGNLVLKKRKVYVPKDEALRVEII